MWSSVIAHENGLIPDCCSLKDHDSSEDLIPISLSRQCSIPDNAQFGVAIDRHTDPDHNFTSAKSCAFAPQCRIIQSVTFSPDDNLLNFMFYTKAGLVREERYAPESRPNPICSRPTFYGHLGDPLLMEHRPLVFEHRNQHVGVGFKQFESKLWYQ
ncbi:hypothetical protein AVEN_2575-1 [Araneus ventricosus]|uniref:Uncharacterized protein n=1 Tax=Araneus ventricosus TaxID=182803 RepID=A0A4Y2GSR0_ARAVE|nr:hypothetical protein AVEN_2575-1 [Araneus ventricosus]